MKEHGISMHKLAGLSAKSAANKDGVGKYSAKTVLQTCHSMLMDIRMFITCEGAL